MTLVISFLHMLTSKNTNKLKLFLLGIPSKSTNSETSKK